MTVICGARAGTTAFIYDLFVKNKTSAPNDTYAKAAMIPTEGHHIEDNKTKTNKAIRVKGMEYASTNRFGKGVSKLVATTTLKQNRRMAKESRKYLSTLSLGWRTSIQDISYSFEDYFEETNGTLF
jgi:hypothetical protein